MAAIAEIIRDLLIFIVVMFVAFVALLIIVSKLPANNPLKRILIALSFRVGATLGAGAVAIPIEPIPGIDAIYDIGVPIALVYFWYTFLRDIYRSTQLPPSEPSASRTRMIDHDRI